MFWQFLLEEQGLEIRHGQHYCNLFHWGRPSMQLQEIQGSGQGLEDPPPILEVSELSLPSWARNNFQSWASEGKDSGLSLSPSHWSTLRNKQQQQGNWKNKATSDFCSLARLRHQAQILEAQKAVFSFFFPF